MSSARPAYYFLQFLPLMNTRRPHMMSDLHAAFAEFAQSTLPLGFGVLLSKIGSNCNGNPATTTALIHIAQYI